MSTVESSSTQVVDEHFARSLGSEYMRLLKHPAAPSSAPPPASSSLDTSPLSASAIRPGGHISVSGTVWFSYCVVIVSVLFRRQFSSPECHRHTHTHTRLTALFPGLPGWASTRKVKPIWISLKHETVSGSGISCAICKSAPCSRQITMTAPHHSVFYSFLPFLPPNQQRQSTGINIKFKTCKLLYKFSLDHLYCIVRTSLGVSLHPTSSTDCFRRLLKTYLFAC